MPRAQKLALGALFGTVVAALVGFCWWRLHVARRAADELAARERRQTEVALVAPAVAPAAIPLVGPPGVDAAGYPLRNVDRAALRSLLHFARWDELTAYVEQLQAEFESDPRKERWPLDAASAFETAEPALRASLDAWVAARPGSFAPLLARGSYLVDVGSARRGGKWAKDTPEADMVAMSEAFALARADFDRVLAMRPRVFAATRGLVRMGPEHSKRSSRALVDEATALCPQCFEIRWTYVLYDVPRWGGSYDDLRRYAATAPVRDNPTLALLPGVVDTDRADLAAADKDLDGAMAAVQRANALGEHWYFLRERARYERAKGDLDASLADVTRALELRPGRPDLLFQRAGVHDARKDWERSAIDLVAGLRVDATRAAARALVPRAVQGLLSIAVEADKRGDTAKALRLLDLAADLEPGRTDVQQWRARMVRGGTTAAALPTGSSTDDEVATASARAAAAPDDFEAHRALDYALARRGQYEQVVTMWNAYLQRNPKEGRAFLERGGAQIHLGRVDGAKADATRACDLGVSEGCARARQVSGRR